MKENDIGTQVLEAAINLHRAHGPELLELKSVERISSAHKKQVQTYLRLTGLEARIPALRYFHWVAGCV